MKYIVLTGCCGGIGKKIREDLLKNDYYVFGIDLKDDEFKADNYSFFQADITDEKQIVSIKEEILKQTKEIYGVINASGMFKMKTFTEADVQAFKKIMDVNVIGVMIINKTFIPLLLNQGRIINITSEVARYSPQPFNGYYQVSKVALDDYNDVLRRECNYLGIKVIKIQSGAIKTNLLTGVNSDYDEIVKETKYFKNQLAKLKFMMDKEITKENPPDKISKLILKILKVKKTKMCYRISNSFSLSFLNFLPESLQDYIYRKVIK